MFVRHYRSLHARFDAAGLGAAMAPRKPRNPLLRFAVGLLGVALLAALLAVGLVVGTAMLVAGLLRRLVTRDAARPAAARRIVDGEFRVLRKPVLPVPR